MLEMLGSVEHEDPATRMWQKRVTCLGLPTSAFTSFCQMNKLRNLGQFFLCGTIHAWQDSLVTLGKGRFAGNYVDICEWTSGPLHQHRSRCCRLVKWTIVDGTSLFS